MQEPIKHFIWGFQRHFRHSLEQDAVRVLESLKVGLTPKVFLVGVRIRDSDTGCPACVEPEVNHWAFSSDLYGVLADARASRTSTPEPQIIQSHPDARRSEDDRLFRLSLRDAVVRRLEGSPLFPVDTMLFASFPIERDGFLVMSLLTVAKSVIDSTPRVEGGTIQVSPVHTLDVPCSLAESLIERILERANLAIIQPDAGKNLWVLGDVDHVLRDAGSRFFEGLLKRVDEESLMIGRAAEAFDILANLSLSPYEKAEAQGQLILADKSVRIGSPVLTFAEPLQLRQGRALRKLLALTNDEIALRCDCVAASSLVRTSDREDRSHLVVRFVRRGKWAVSFNDAELMVIADGRPSLPEAVVDEARISRDLRRVMPSVTESVAVSFAQIGSQLASSGHGGIVVITEAAREEAARLGKESLPLTPSVLTPELASMLTKIDGAILCDTAGMCHAVGVILDGKATDSGDRSRGSRFNSAARYVHGNDPPCVALVVSDDGGIDFLPHLRPPLSKAELVARLDELRRLASDPSDPPDRDREVEAMSWFDANQYYLNQLQCDEANNWIGICDDRAFQGESIRVSKTRLKTDPEFRPERDLA